MNRKEKEPKIGVIALDRGEEGEYSLLRVRWGGLCRYLFCVEQGKEGEMALFTGQEAEARRLYGRILAGNLAAVHLTDVVRDQCRYIEIF